MSGLKERRRKEQKQEIEKRKKQVQEAAFACFREKGIENVTISEVAARAQVGEATVYRYFAAKDNLAVECGTDFWKHAGDRFDQLCEKEEYLTWNGITQVEALMKLALQIFLQEQESFAFLHDLDGFLLSHRVEKEKLKDYEIQIDRPRPLLCSAIDRGKADGSILSREATVQLYYTLTTAIFGIMQKLAGNGALLAGDLTVEPVRKVELLMELLLRGLGSQEG